MGYLYTTTVTDYTLVANGFEFSTIAFPLFGRSENLLAEESVTFRT
jgi:hypothetical protein